MFFSHDFSMQEVNIWHDVLEGMSCTFKEVVDLIKWCACDYSWIY